MHGHFDERLRRGIGGLGAGATTEQTMGALGNRILDFPVGAAILAENEAGERRIFGGCNVMNAAFPTNVCAETTAGVKAVSEGYRTFLQVACVASLDNPGGAPCGQCRQLVREFGSGAIVYIVMDKENNVETWTMDELFPVSFGPDKTGLQRTEKPTG